MNKDPVNLWSDTVMLGVGLYATFWWTVITTGANIVLGLKK